MNARVLVVDDFDDAREMYAAFLGSSGYEVLQAATGEQAIQIATDVGCDLIVLDIALPGIDGISVIRVLRGRGVQTPIVTLSASTVASVGDKVLAAGGNLALEKPCLPEELERTIRDLLEEMPARIDA
jgi:two-component system cell cycle response regulator DivK